MNDNSVRHGRYLLDSTLTVQEYGKLAAVDPTCCDACATYANIVEGRALPADFMRVLDLAGIDPLKPVEVWGVPEAGFLNGFFVLAGVLQGEPWDGSALHAFEEPEPGFRYWITETLSMTPESAFLHIPVLQVEFVWESDQITRLARHK